MKSEYGTALSELQQPHPPLSAGGVALIAGGVEQHAPQSRGQQEVAGEGDAGCLLPPRHTVHTTIRSRQVEGDHF